MLTDETTTNFCWTRGGHGAALYPSSVAFSGSKSCWFRVACWLDYGPTGTYGDFVELSGIEEGLSSPLLGGFDCSTTFSFARNLKLLYPSRISHSFGDTTATFREFQVTVIRCVLDVLLRSLNFRFLARRRTTRAE
jgi:hypothetical protein